MFYFSGEKLAGAMTVLFDLQIGRQEALFIDFNVSNMALLCLLPRSEFLRMNALNCWEQELKFRLVAIVYMKLPGPMLSPFFFLEKCSS